MDDFIIARIIHVVAILFWIGGVGFVTSVVMPSIREGSPSEERLAAFHRIEGRFAWQARIWVALAGASGFWMVYRADLWSRYADPHFWWMHAMLLVWLLFAIMLFVIEPLFLHRQMANSSSRLNSADGADALDVAPIEHHCAGRRDRRQPRTFLTELDELVALHTQGTLL